MYRPDKYTYSNNLNAVLILWLNYLKKIYNLEYI